MATIGRKLAMMTTFGNDSPSESIVHSHTFTQIYMEDVNYIKFQCVDKNISIFESSKNWIGEPSDLKNMLGGGLSAYPKAGIEACRIETTYRFLFKEIWFGPSGKTSQFLAEGDAPEVEWSGATKGPFTLVLVSFGCYFWDEMPSIKITRKLK